jgi:hypothetical protein
MMCRRRRRILSYYNYSFVYIDHGVKEEEGS